MNSWGNILSLLIEESSSSSGGRFESLWNFCWISLTVYSNSIRSGCSHSSYGRTFFIQAFIKCSDIVKLRSISTLFSIFSSKGKLAQPGGAFIRGSTSLCLSSLALRNFDSSSSRTLESSLQMRVHAYIPYLISFVEIYFLCQIIIVDLISLTFETDSRELKNYKMSWLGFNYFGYSFVESRAI